MILTEGMEGLPPEGTMGLLAATTVGGTRVIRTVLHVPMARVAQGPSNPDLVQALAHGQRQIGWEVAPFRLAGEAEHLGYFIQVWLLAGYPGGDPVIELYLEICREYAASTLDASLLD